MRWGLLLAATLMLLAVLGAADPDLQPSALRLMVTAVVALLSPMFWPGIAATRKGTVLRIVSWSMAAVGLAALALSAFGATRQSLPRVFEACAMLCLVLIVANALTAFLDASWRGASIDARASRELAGRSVALALALFGSLPLWLGPAGEALTFRREWAIDATLALSPVVHLAIASGNDLLRNHWFYEHSNIASLQFEYPGLSAIVWSYALVLLVLGLLAMTLRRWGWPVCAAARAD